MDFQETNNKVKETFTWVIIILILSFNSGCQQYIKKGKTEKKDPPLTIVKKKINNPLDIINITDSLVPPVIYTKAIPLDTLPVNIRKKKFFDMMLPAVLLAQRKIEITRNKVIELSKKEKLSPEEELYMDSLKVTFKTKQIKILIRRLHPVPPSIVLAQSAIESGWGTSRFFIDANNPFGMWSFDPNHSRISALKTRDGKEIFLRKFPSLEASIEAYNLMIATGKPYKRLRQLLQKTDNPYIIIKGLQQYSERGDEYVNEVSNLIKYNNLNRFNHYRINPYYFKD